jgi:hypothetical protein
MDIEPMDDFREDIPFSEAYAASRMISFVPERRAKQTIDHYFATLTEDLKDLTSHATTREKLAILADEFARYRAGYRERYLVCLRAASRTMSPMITGPSNFPVARNRRRINTALKRWEELRLFRDRALKAIKRALCPELAPNDRRLQVAAEVAGKVSNDGY